MVHLHECARFLEIRDIASCKKQLIVVVKTDGDSPESYVWDTDNKTWVIGPDNARQFL